MKKEITQFKKNVIEIFYNINVKKMKDLFKKK